MHKHFVIELLQNIAILLAFSMIYENFWIKNENSRNFSTKLFTGIIIGAVGVVIIYTRWTLVPGIVFDTRSVMLSISGLFFGPIPTIIAIIITSFYRIVIGGDGLMMGLAVIISSGTIGCLWRWLRPEWKEKNYIRELLAMGIVVHISMLAATLLLPEEIRISTIKAIALPLIFLYIPATVLLGMLMLGQWNNFQNRKAREILRVATESLNKELIIAKEKAEESDRLKSAFLANLSHEIRTPMNAILGFTELLKENDIPDEKRDYYGSIIQNSGRHLISIIDDIIEISKIETRQAQVHATRINIQLLLEEVYQLMNINMPKGKEIELILRLPAGGKDDYFISDAVKLKQIISNLINNAFKFTDKGFVEFGYELNNELTFFVRDTGHGIDKSNHNLIFERFRQIGTELTVNKGGSGLGLAIVKSYAELLGGKVLLESEPEKGSLFKVVFPFSEN